MINNIEKDQTYLDNFEHVIKLEKLISLKLGLERFYSGIHIIRDQNGWRENEKKVDYIWMVCIARSFVGWGGLFSVKFSENNFRGYLNQAELVQGIFVNNPDGTCHIYADTKSDTTDRVAEKFHVNLLESEEGIALDGVDYTIRIIANKTSTYMRLNNPKADQWRNWEEEIIKLGKELSTIANDEEMINLFK